MVKRIKNSSLLVNFQEINYFCLVLQSKKMTTYKTFFITILAFCFCEFAIAKGKTDQAFPYIFVGVQGGMQTTFGKDYSNAKLLTPTTSVSLGAAFTPFIGTRLHVNGLWNKGGYAGDDNNFKYRYKYTTINIDMMINLVNIISRRTYSSVNVYFINGFGLNMAWDNEDAYAHKDVLPVAYNATSFSHNVRLGIMIDYNITKNFCVNLEVNGNCLNDRYNSKASNHQDWQLTAQLGVAYKLGCQKR